MAAKLLDSANKLPAGPLSRGVLEEIGKFGARITALKAKADERIPQAKAVSGSAWFGRRHDLDQRLSHAGNYLAHVQGHEIPEEHRELGEIKAIMFATQLSLDRVRRATEDGTKLAHRILELYTRVMGGLQTSHARPITRGQGEAMTNTLREFERAEPITKAERAARKVFRQVEAHNVMTEHEIAQKAFHANRERLKAERLAREAAGAPVAAKAAKSKKKSR
jgi:hypothetical protein